MTANAMYFPQPSHGQQHKTLLHKPVSRILLWEAHVDTPAQSEHGKRDGGQGERESEREGKRKREKGEGMGEERDREGGGEERQRRK